jgi:hypothetical protein
MIQLTLNDFFISTNDAGDEATTAIWVVDVDFEKRKAGEREGATQADYGDMAI